MKMSPGPRGPGEQSARLPGPELLSPETPAKSAYASRPSDTTARLRVRAECQCRSMSLVNAIFVRQVDSAVDRVLGQGQRATENHDDDTSGKPETNECRPVGR